MRRLKAQLRISFKDQAMPSPRLSKCSELLQPQREDALLPAASPRACQGPGDLAPSGRLHWADPFAHEGVVPTGEGRD